MRSARVVFVTGKGGVGKTTVSAALGLHLAASGQRTLIVETDASGRLAALFGGAALGPEPVALQPRLFAARVHARTLLEDYFRSLLRLPFLSRRLLSSRTFNALTAAAPGVAEFLVLDKLLHWLEPGWRPRRRFDTVVVDGPATGHARALLAAPRTIAALVPAGPIGTVARRARALLADRHRARVVLVTLPEELAITETLEAHATLVNELALHVTRPVLNRVFPRRFSRDEIDTLSAGDSDDPLTRAALFEASQRRETERHLARLRRGIPDPPLAIPMVFDERLAAPQLAALGTRLAALLPAE